MLKEIIFSTNSVNRILDSISKDKYVKNNGKLPTSFGIDEFSATKDTISKMAFIIVNQDTHNIFDINNSRLSNDIYNYFSRYQRFERNKVKFITWIYINIIIHQCINYFQKPF